MALLPALACCAGWPPLVWAGANGPGIDVGVLWPDTLTRRVELLVDGSPACATEGQRRTPDGSDESSCHVALGAGPHRLQVNVSGVFKADSIRSARTARPISTTFQVRDGAALTAPLRDERRDVAARWIAAVAAETEFARPDGALVLQKLGAPASAADVAAAEARLGFALPPDYHALVQHAGALAIGDHSVVRPADLVRGDQEMAKEWGHPTERWPEAARTRIARSVALFVEVGDGIGAEFHVADPALCDGRGGLLWMHEDELASFIRALFDGKVDCRPFAAVLQELQQRYVFGEHTDSLYDEQNVVLFDSGAAAHKWWLRIDTAAGKVGLTPTDY